MSPGDYHRATLGMAELSWGGRLGGKLPKVSSASLSPC